MRLKTQLLSALLAGLASVAPAEVKPGASFALNAVSVHPYLPPLGGLR